MNWGFFKMSLIIDCGDDRELAVEMHSYSMYGHYDGFDEQDCYFISIESGIVPPRDIRSHVRQGHVLTEDVDYFILEAAKFRHEKRVKHNRKKHMLRVVKDVEWFFDFFEIPESGIFGYDRSVIEKISRAYDDAVIVSSRDYDDYKRYCYHGYKEIFSADELRSLGYI